MDNHYKKWLQHTGHILSKEMTPISMTISRGKHTIMLIVSTATKNLTPLIVS
jgi:hypothetical protein